MKRWRRTSLVVLCVALCCGAGRSLARGAESNGHAAPAKRFSLEFRDADIKDVLRLLGQENGLNILVGDDVTGKVTVSFKEVTLDQALVSILQSFGYSYTTSDGIVTVSNKPSPKPAPEQIVINVRDKLISLDFRDAEAKDVLRLLGKKSGINIIVGDEIAGKISVSLKDVTLDQALHSVLQGFGCAYSINDGIVLVTRNPNPGQFVSRTIKILYLVDSNTVGAADQSKQELEVLAASLRPLLSSQQAAPVSRYQEQAAETVPGAKSGVVDNAAAANKTDKGGTVSDSGPSIRVFPRISTLVVTDLPERVEKIAALIKELDKPLPQIKIEARIVEVKDIYQKELGIQWGAQFNADATHGNALPYAFPNSVNVGGNQGAAGNYLVNLPATSPVAGVGISMGHIANIFSLDLKLSAMEKMDKIKILSTPSVMAMHGKEAIIKVGEQIPYTSSTTTGGIVNTTTQTINFKDIVLQLRVIPTVLPEGRIILDLVVNKDSRGQEVVFQNEHNFSIDTKSVTTRVSLQDGETGVIGGLYTQQENGGTSQVPLLGRIPLLGWLFRARNENKVRNELLIFLTPRIQAL